MWFCELGFKSRVFVTQNEMRILSLVISLLNCSPVVEVVEALGPAACELLVGLGQDVLPRLGAQLVEEAEPRRLLLRFCRVSLDILQHAHQSLKIRQ